MVTWEWRDGIRSWLFPDALYAIMRATTLLHLPPETARPAVWAVLSLVATGGVVAGTWLGWQRAGLAGGVLCGLLSAFWPDLVYFGPKTLLEVQGGTLLGIAAVLASATPGRRPTLRLATIGLLLGLAFDLRFQLAPALLVVAIGAARREWRRWAALGAAAAGAVALLGIIDAVAWGSPFQSIWKNVQVNLLEGRAASYGVQPATWYVGEVIRRYGVAVLPLGVCFWLGARRAKLLAAVAATVVLEHSLIGHKEISFIYAALPPAMVVVGLGSAWLVEAAPALLRRPGRSGAALDVVAASWAAIALLTLVALSPFRQPAEARGLRTLWEGLRTAPDLCGVGLVGQRTALPLFYLTAYSGLGRTVPVYLPGSPADLSRASVGFNYLIGMQGDDPVTADFSLQRCEGGVCLWHRPGACTAVPDLEINPQLVRDGL